MWCWRSGLTADLKTRDRIVTAHYVRGISLRMFSYITLTRSIATTNLNPDKMQ